MAKGNINLHIGSTFDDAGFRRLDRNIKGANKTIGKFGRSFGSVVDASKNVATALQDTTDRSYEFGGSLGNLAKSAAPLLSGFLSMGVWGVVIGAIGVAAGFIKKLVTLTQDARLAAKGMSREYMTVEYRAKRYKEHLDALVVKHRELVDAMKEAAAISNEKDAADLDSFRSQVEYSMAVAENESKIVSEIAAQAKLKREMAALEAKTARMKKNASVKVGVEDPEPVDIKVNEPKSIEVKASAPDPVSVKTIAPDPVHVETVSPQPVKVAAQPPAPVSVDTVTPKPVKVAAQPPAPVSVDTVTPQPVKVSAVSPAPVTVKAIAPDPVDVVANEPKPVSVKTATPEPIKVTTAEPPAVAVTATAPAPVKVKAVDPKPVSVKATAQTVDIPVNEPTASVKVIEPKPVAVDAIEPSPVNVKVNDPKPVKVAAEATKPVNVDVKQPKPVKVAAEKPEPVNVDVKQPKPVKVAAEKPKPVNVDVKQPKPVKVAAEKPKPVEVEMVTAQKAYENFEQESAWQIEAVTKMANAEIAMTKAEADRAIAFERVEVAARTRALESATEHYGSTSRAALAAQRDLIAAQEKMARTIEESSASVEKSQKSAEDSIMRANMEAARQRAKIAAAMVDEVRAAGKDALESAREAGKEQIRAAEAAVKIAKQRVVIAESDREKNLATHDRKTARNESVARFDINEKESALKSAKGRSRGAHATDVIKAEVALAASQRNLDSITKRAAIARRRMEQEGDIAVSKAQMDLARATNALTTARLSAKNAEDAVVAKNAEAITAVKRQARVIQELADYKAKELQTARRSQALNEKALKQNAALDARIAEAKTAAAKWNEEMARVRQRDGEGRQIDFNEFKRREKKREREQKRDEQRGQKINAQAEGERNRLRDRIFDRNGKLRKSANKQDIARWQELNKFIEMRRGNNPHQNAVDALEKQKAKNVEKIAKNVADIQKELGKLGL